MIDIASAHTLTITRSLNVTDGSFSASFITQSESDNDFPSAVRISLSSFSYKLTDWSSFFTLFTSLFAALKNPEALAENDTLIASLLLSFAPHLEWKLREEEEEEEEERDKNTTDGSAEVEAKVVCVPPLFAEVNFELAKAFVLPRLLFLLSEEYASSRNDDAFALPLVDGKLSIVNLLDARQ
jgi:hypothetical protein